MNGTMSRAPRTLATVPALLGLLLSTFMATAPATAVGHAAPATPANAAASSAVPSGAGGKLTEKPLAVVDDFEGTLKVGTAAPGLWAFGSDAASTPTLTRVPAGDRPGAGGGNNALQISATIGSWGGFTDDFTQYQDWHQANGFAFWVKGSGSGEKIEFEVKTGGTDGEHAELWQSFFKDDSTTWKLVTVPFAQLTKRADHQEPGAPDEARIALADVWGYAVNLPPGPAVTLQLDDVQTYQTVHVIQDFDGASPITDVNGAQAAGGAYSWGGDAASVPALSIVPADYPGESGNNELRGAWSNDTSYGGFSYDLATGATEDWRAFTGVEFWFYGRNPQADAAPGSGQRYEFEIKEGGPDAEHAELWQTFFTDDWQGWHLIQIPFSSLTLRKDFQPTGAPTGTELDLSNAYGFALTEPPGTTNGYFDVYGFAVYGSAPPPSGPIGRGAVTAGVAGMCLNAGDNSGRTVEQDAADLWRCDASHAERWTLANGTLRTDGLCLDVQGAVVGDGSPVVVWDCDGGKNQSWTAVKGELVSGGSGKCLTAPGGKAVNGGQLVISTCTGSPLQRWTTSAAFTGTTAPSPKPTTKSSSSLAPRILAAVLLVGLGLALGLRRPRHALINAVRATGSAIRSLRAPALIRRRRLSPKLTALLADPATTAVARTAIAAVGEGDSWWPFAAVVTKSDITVWLAGIRIPEPEAPWRSVPGDRQAWIAARTDLAETVAVAADGRLVLLGVLKDAVVVADVARAHDLLVIGGDDQRAEQVRASLAEQLEGVEVLLRGTDTSEGRPHWALDVDVAGRLRLHGRQVDFVAPPTVK